MVLPFVIVGLTAKPVQIVILENSVTKSYLFGYFHDCVRFGYFACSLLVRCALSIAIGHVVVFSEDVTP